MKNSDRWRPSKFIYRDGRLVASRDLEEVGVSSRLAANLVAACYDTYIKKYVHGKLIDLGCGKVPLYQAYKEFATEIICVDWQNTLHPNEYLDFECDLTAKLPFADGEFDVIILSDVLEHIPRPELLWGEMTRILSKDGCILMNVPFYYWLHEQPHDFYRYTEYALKRFVESSGLTLVLLKPIGGAPEILADILAKVLANVSGIGKPLSRFVQWCAALSSKTKWGEKISVSTAKVFPFGYFMVAQK